ncbi:hypothetical protein [uncultured Treponema sp.]|uniref:hypothetical protein n=1 Tax=uncultured Treponema sp. TaxID=162155 RepID=UPI0025F22CBF|nr:hypothetical protein [uncultured Treponema sp.]
MIKTYEIDLEDSLVEKASELFETLGTDIDVAIAIFLKQALLRKGFPFEVAIPEDSAGGEDLSKSENACESQFEDDLHGGVSEEEECNVATVTSESSVSPEIAARVAANEALVAEMRNEIGDKEVTPEFDQNEDDGTHGDYDSTEVKNGDDDEDEDENTPDNLFDAWDVGDEEEIGCR